MFSWMVNDTSQYLEPCNCVQAIACLKIVTCKFCTNNIYIYIYIYIYIHYLAWNKTQELMCDKIVNNQHSKKKNSNRKLFSFALVERFPYTLKASVVYPNEEMITLIYKNIFSRYYRKLAELFVREIPIDGELLTFNIFRFTSGGDTTPEVSLLFCASLPGDRSRAAFSARNSTKTACLLTAYHWLCWLTALPRDWKLPSLYIFRTPTQLFQRISRGNAAVPCLP